MTLSEYKIDRGLTLAALGALIGFPLTTVHAWITGRRRPEPEYLARIVAATAGVVSAAELRPDLAVLFEPKLEQPASELDAP